MNKNLILNLVVVLALLAAGCSGAGKGAPLEVFMEAQKAKISHKDFSRQAEPLFHAWLYEPTHEDMQALRAAWNEHARAFPESKAITEIEKVLSTPGERVLLLTLYTSDIDKSDVANKALGWSVSPVPSKIKELSDTDIVLRTLMPVKNQWARYFLLSYNQPVWSDAAATVIVGLAEGKVELQRLHLVCAAHPRNFPFWEETPGGGGGPRPVSSQNGKLRGEGA